jgi:hypothetical protein
VITCFASRGCRWSLARQTRSQIATSMRCRHTAMARRSRTGELQYDRCTACYEEPNAAPALFLITAINIKAAAHAYAHSTKPHEKTAAPSRKQCWKQKPRYSGHSSAGVWQAQPPCSGGEHCGCGCDNPSTRATGVRCLAAGRLPQDQQQLCGYSACNGCPPCLRHSSICCLLL